LQFAEFVPALPHQDPVPEQILWSDV